MARRRTCYVLRLACAVMGLALLLSTRVWAQEDGVSLRVDEYVDQLEAARNALLRGDDLADVQADLAVFTAVSLEDGTVMEIEPILADVRDPENALRRLTLVLAQMEESRDDHTAARLAQLQVVRDRFNLDRPSFWDRVLRWISDLFDALTPDQVPDGAAAIADIGSRIVVWAVVISGGALLAILLSYWFRRFFGAILADRLGRRQSQDDIPATAAEARSQAQQLAGAGNYRAAVRQLYLSALLHLDEQGLLRFQRDLTNREVLAQTKPGTDVHTHLKPAVETFDRVWYGEHEPDRPTFESYRGEIDELMAQTAEDKRV